MSAQNENVESAYRSTDPPSTLAQGFIVFASVMMIMIGAFQVLIGLSGLFEDEIYVATPSYVLEFDTTVWGWIHLLLGVVVLFAGTAVLSGRVWGRIVGISLAVVSAVVNFAFIPYYPFWSMIIIALNVFVIWALAAHGRDIARDA